VKTVRVPQYVVVRLSRYLRSYHAVAEIMEMQ